MLCPNLSNGVGEHVWPSWFLHEFAGQGPFTADKGGRPYTRRDGAAVAFTSLGGVHVPMCQACNTQLNRTIEEPAKPVVRKLLEATSTGTWPTLTDAEVAALARWLLKVGLLKAHPDAVHDSPHINSDADYPRQPILNPAWLDWMRTGINPPRAFSVYLTRRATAAEPAWTGEKQLLLLPRVVVNQQDLFYTTWRVGFLGIEATIVWHPGWPIVHPLVQQSRAVRLWPDPRRVDLALLPEMHPREFGFIADSHARMFHDEDELAEAARIPLQVGLDPITRFLAEQGQPDLLP